MTSSPVSLRVERRLIASGARTVCAVDEVGRGALSGPVSVGMVLIDATVRRSLPGVRDSKLLTARKREELVPRIRRWAIGHAVGHSSAEEIDGLGIIAALRLAGHRALAALPMEPDVVLLDGSHDWLSWPVQADLFAVQESPAAWVPPVTTLVKADLTCASVAAASVLAKTERDGLMRDLAVRHSVYGWHENKGYASPAHIDALARFGPCEQHRRSWQLPGVG